MNRQQRRATQNRKRNGDDQSSPMETLSQGTADTLGTFKQGVRSTYIPDGTSYGYEPISTSRYDRSEKKQSGFWDWIFDVSRKVGVIAIFGGAIAAVSYIVVIGYGISKSADAIQGDVKEVRTRQEKHGDELRNMDNKLIRIESSVGRLEQERYTKPKN